MKEFDQKNDLTLEEDNAVSTLMTDREEALEFLFDYVRPTGPPKYSLADIEAYVLKLYQNQDIERTAIGKEKARDTIDYYFHSVVAGYGAYHYRVITQLVRELAFQANTRTPLPGRTTTRGKAYDPQSGPSTDDLPRIKFVLNWLSDDYLVKCFQFKPGSIDRSGTIPVEDDDYRLAPEMLLNLFKHDKVFVKRLESVIDRTNKEFKKDGAMWDHYKGLPHDNVEYRVNNLSSQLPDFNNLLCQKQDGFGCGTNSSATILNFYGYSMKQKDIDWLIRDRRIGKDSGLGVLTPPAELMQMLRDFGVSVHPFEFNRWRDIVRNVDMNIPMIAMIHAGGWGNRKFFGMIDHYVIIDGYKVDTSGDQYIHISDPNKGGSTKWWKFQDFRDFKWELKTGYDRFYMALGRGGTGNIPHFLQYANTQFFHEVDDMDMGLAEMFGSIKDEAAKAKEFKKIRQADKVEKDKIDAKHEGAIEAEKLDVKDAKDDLKAAEGVFEKLSALSNLLVQRSELKNEKEKRKQEQEKRKQKKKEDKAAVKEDYAEGVKEFILGLFRATVGTSLAAGLLNLFFPAPVFAVFGIGASFGFWWIPIIVAANFIAHQILSFVDLLGMTMIDGGRALMSKKKWGLTILGALLVGAGAVTVFVARVGQLFTGLIAGAFELMFAPIRKLFEWITGSMKIRQMVNDKRKKGELHTLNDITADWYLKKLVAGNMTDKDLRSVEYIFDASQEFNTTGVTSEYSMKLILTGNPKMRKKLFKKMKKKRAQAFYDQYIKTKLTEFESEFKSSNKKVV